uniref:ADP-ribosylation factor-like protein 13B n=1 Tax=Romanomermis culicivorax TaxID=13658 RepID=A0A915ITB3_ROMCU
MGNCFKSSRTVPLKIITLAVFGLDKAGKTTAIRTLKRDRIDDVVPTVGFSVDNMKIGKSVEVILYDIGGSPKIRQIWRNYFAEIHGLIYVVDASDRNRIEENKQELMKLLSDPRIQGKPCLLLLNKQDINGAYDENDAADGFLPFCIFHFKETCSMKWKSKNGFRRKKIIDQNLKTGFDWLVSYVSDHFLDLNKKVENDVETRRLEIERENIARRDRIEKMRAEDEALERRKKNEGGDIDSKLHNVVDDGQLPSTSNVSTNIMVDQRESGLQVSQYTEKYIVKNLPMDDDAQLGLDSSQSSIPTLPPIGSTVTSQDKINEIRKDSAEDRKIGRQIIVVGQSSKPDDDRLKISSVAISNGSAIHYSVQRDTQVPLSTNENEPSLPTARKRRRHHKRSKQKSSTTVAVQLENLPPQTMNGRENAAFANIKN